MKKLALFLLLFFYGCSQGKLQVQSEFLTADRYASVFVGTPDPKKICPDIGQRLCIQWKLKKELRCYDEVHLYYTILLRNYERIDRVLPIHCPVGRIFHVLMNEDFFETSGILAYDVQIWAGENLIAQKKHHLFREFITPSSIESYELQPDEIEFDPIDDLDFDDPYDLSYIHEKSLKFNSFGNGPQYGS